MKVKVFGIQFNTGKAVTVSQFFDHLIASNTTNIDFHGFKRFLYLKKIWGQIYRSIRHH